VTEHPHHTTVSDPELAHRALTVTRILDAPRGLVFQAWTEPEHLSHWWGPHGMTAPLSSIEVDVRPGGNFCLVMVDDASGEEMPVRGVFREVVEPERLVFTLSGHPANPQRTETWSIRFVDLGDKTEMTLDYVGYSSADEHAGFVEGVAEHMDRLVTYLG
jgi:uncharacterized protein YndB with AHSA1/START domain